MFKIKNWVLKNKLEFAFLTLILLTALFLRIYRIDEYMTFLGDEGRDALMIKRILTEFDIPLIGPPTSIGNMYLGPLYYYMMTIPLAISWLNPISAAMMNSLLGVGSVFLIYFLGKSWFSKSAGLISAFLYAISPITIIYSRSSWNPNPTPFFALLAILGFYKAKNSGDFRWFILTGVSLAFAIQMHYLALILLPIFGLLWFYELSLIWRGKLKTNHLFFGTIGTIAVFLILMSPLLVFDLKHNFMNYRAISTFFTARETTVNLNPLNTFERVVPIYTHNLTGRYLTGEYNFWSTFLSILILIPLLFALIEKLFFKKTLGWAYLMLGTWLIIGVLGLALYKQSIYDHYLGFLNPLPFLLLGGLVHLTLSNLKIKYLNFVLILFLVVALTVINLERSPLKAAPNNQLFRTQDIAKFVIAQANNKPFNFALIAEHNYDSAYQFYLDLYGNKPKVVPVEITDQLFVVCEDKICQPVGHPKYEIAGFGWTKIEMEQDFAGVKVFKLIHNPDQDASKN